MIPLTSGLRAHLAGHPEGCASSVQELSGPELRGLIQPHHLCRFRHKVSQSLRREDLPGRPIKAAATAARIVCNNTTGCASSNQVLGQQ